MDPLDRITFSGSSKEKSLRCRQWRVEDPGRTTRHIPSKLAPSPKPKMFRALELAWVEKGWDGVSRLSLPRSADGEEDRR